MDIQEFFGIEQVEDDRHWRMKVRPGLCTPGDFLFGGCGLGASLVALEHASERPTIWATAQYLSYAPTGSLLDVEVILAAQGGHVTQGRAVASVEGREILTVNAALGDGELDGEVWVTHPDVPPPLDCPPRVLPKLFRNSILDAVEVRVAKGRPMADFDGTPGDPDTALWARVPGHLEPSAGTLAIFGDYVAGSAGQPLGRHIMGRSLDNTLRMVQLARTEWVLCDIRMHALAGGMGQGMAFLWSEDGVLLATASQSMTVKLWPLDVPFPE
jgi:acyl-CoA thioesterase II